jgi:oligopeptidase B
MTTPRSALLIIGAALVSCATAPSRSPHPAAAVAAEEPRPPVAQRVPYKETLHGIERVDEYHWLRQKDTPEVVSYLQAENAYTQAMLRPTEPLQQRLYDEMLARVKQTDVSAPSRQRGYFYFERTVAGQQYPIFCRKSAKGAAPDDRTGNSAVAPEEVMLDLNELGKTHKFVRPGAIAISDDNRMMAYALDLTGFRQFTLHVKDLAGGRSFAEEMARVDSVAWARDGKTLFYVVEDAVAKRPNRLYRHVLGDKVEHDALVYEEKDEMFELSLDETRDHQWLVLTSESKTTTEVRVLRADRPNGAFSLVEPRQHDVRYYLEHRGTDFYIRTDAPARPSEPKARNFRLVTAPVSSPGRAHWKELVAHDDNVMLLGVELFSARVVLRESVDAEPQLVVLPIDGRGRLGKAETIALPEPIGSVSDAREGELVAPNSDFDSDAFRFHFESPLTPPTVYDWDAHTHQLTRVKQEEVLGGYDATRYATERLHAVAVDGTKVPLTIVHRKDLAAGTPHPLLLYGYGSYGIPTMTRFSSENVSLLDRGVVYALAHIRGGGDLGTRWHEQGRMATKMNTFTDFIACAEALVKQGWTAADKLVIRGGSAGGLLMGAVTNMRPDLFKAVVAQVPFVDVINTMLDESLPLTVGEFEEWGNPKNKGDYDLMIKYSPYDNVAKKNYPAMLVMTSYNDSQVMYWEPAKWVARLRAFKTDHNPLLLHVNMEPAGHGGHSGRYDRLHEQALMFAFVLRELGIAQ